MSRITGFTGCYLMIVGYSERIFLSESGCPGLQDLQDVI
jgi:hypothetical protein